MRLLLRSTHGLTPQTRPLAGRAFAELKRRAKEQLRSVRKRSISSLELDTQKEAPFLKTEAVKHLGVNAQAFGGKFDARVRALAQKGLGHSGYRPSAKGCTHHRARAHQAVAQRKAETATEQNF